MAEVSTFVKIDRNILQWEWISDANTFAVFMYLILSANVKPHGFKGVTIERGSLATSYDSIANALGLTTSQARTAIAHLKITGEITAKSQGKFQVITVVNYRKFQDVNAPTSQANDNEITGKSQGDDRQVAGKSQQYKNKRIKEVKNKRNNISSYEDIGQNCEQFVPQIMSSSDFSASYSFSGGEEKPKKRTAVDYEQFKRIYNDVCTNLPKVTVLSDKRKRAIHDFCKQLTADDFKIACKNANESNFCIGKNDIGWKANFDFIVRVDKALNLIEGMYENRNTNASAQSFCVDDFFVAAIEKEKRNGG